jgi:mannosyltransferase
MDDSDRTPDDRGLGAHRLRAKLGLRAPRMRPLAGILIVAAALRLWDIDHTSLWYDEVVSMRVARAEGPAALVRRLDQLDGTRAPLHPLALHAWLKLFGSSDLAGRSLSALCGLAAVLVIGRIGRLAFDDRTGLWAAWLAAVCPPMVYYSQEARMYAWLVLLTALSWLVLLSFRSAAGLGRCLAYGLLLTALAYSHPLGLFMIAAHGLAYLLVRPGLLLPFRRWLLIQFSAALAILPWLRRYLDHGTDYPMPRYSLRFLLGVPIEYIGGNRLVLLACLAIIGFGLLGRDPATGRCRLLILNPVENLILITWAAVPPVLMYLYSYMAQPVFGPSRYHLFSAPAYLILVAHGLVRLPPLLRWPIAAAGLALSLSLLHAYNPSVKADWRRLAEWLDQQQARPTTEPITIVVHPSDPRFPREQLEAARYYLSPRFRVVSAGDTTELTGIEPATTYQVYCLIQPWTIEASPPNTKSFYGLSIREEANLSADERR